MQQGTAQVVRQLGHLARGLSSSAIIASVPSTTGSHGLGAPKGLPPMNVPLPGVDPVTPAPVPSSPPATEQRSLQNGVQIGVQNTMSPLASVAIVVKGGSQVENAQFEGASQLLEAMAFKDTSNRTHFATIRQAENYGIVLGAQANRESVAYFATGPRDCVAPAFELLADTVTNPLYADHLLQIHKVALKERNEKLLADPLALAVESLPSAAYTGGLARPKVYTGANINAAMLTDFHDALFVPSSMTVAASGVESSVVDSLAGEFLGALEPKSAAATPPASRYVGGSTALHNPATATALISFETVGWQSAEKAVATTVLQYLLGGGTDFSSGGPGKGMHSALYRNVLCYNDWISGAMAHMDVFEETGLFGAVLSSPSSHKAPELVDILCRELEKAGSAVTDEQVARARNSCLSAVVTALENPTIVSEDIARQIVTYGRRMELSEFKSILESVNASKVKSIAQEIMSGKPSAVLIGDQSVMPKFSTIESRFN